jgi:hypothetical protein
MTNKVDESSPLAPNGDIDEVAVCYLCLDGGDDETGQPLRRDCACRGTDAGFVHLSCLAEYAETKSKAWDGRDTNEFITPWERCPSCDQYYQNYFAVDIASKFVLFVRGQYPDDTQKQVEALHVKLRALILEFRRLQPVQKREAEVTANVLISLIDRLKGEVSPLPIRYSQFEAFAHGVHGQIALDEGTEESARRAEAYFKKSLQVFEAIGDADGVVTAKGFIAFAKSKYEGDSNNDELLKASQELYELRIAEDGEEKESTIRAGRIYAVHLQKANRGDEARDLLTKLLATSKQVFGLDHNITKSVESMLSCTTCQYTAQHVLVDKLL